MKILRILGKTVGFVSKAIITLFEIIFIIMFLLNMYDLSIFGWSCITKNISFIEAEVVSIVDNISTEDNPSSEFGPYSYNVKYVFKEKEIITTQPITTPTLVAEGDIIKVILHKTNGHVSGIDFSWINETLHLLCLTSFCLFTLSLLKKCINIIMNGSAWCVFYGLKKMIFGSISYVCFFFAIVSFFQLFFIIPNYFNGNYINIPSIVSRLEESDINEDGVSANRWYEKYEYKGQWFEPDNYFYSYSYSQKVGDTQHILIDTRTGEFVENQTFEPIFTRLFERIVKGLVAGVILSLIANDTWKRKIKKSSIVVGESEASLTEIQDNIVNDMSSELILEDNLNDANNDILD